MGEKKPFKVNLPVNAKLLKGDILLLTTIRTSDYAILTFTNV